MKLVTHLCNKVNRSTHESFGNIRSLYREEIGLVQKFEILAHVFGGIGFKVETGRVGGIVHKIFGNLVMAGEVHKY